MGSSWFWVAALLASIACTPPARVEPPGPTGSARLTVVHHHEMGDSFRLQTLTYELDGRRVFESRDVAVAQPVVVASEQLPAGAHRIDVTAVYRGNGHGVFSYLKKYKFTVKSNHTVTIADTQNLVVDVKAFEHGGPTTPLEKRPAIDFRVYRAEAANAAP